MVNIALEGFVDLGTLLDDADRVSDLIVGVQEVEQLLNLAVIGVLLQHVGLYYRALDTRRLLKLLCKFGIHKGRKQTVDARDAVEYLGVALVGVEEGFDRLDVHKHIKMNRFGGALHIRLNLQLCAEFIAHCLKQRVVTDLYETVSHLKRGENQTVFVHYVRVVADLLHKALGLNVAGAGIVILDELSVRGKMADDVGVGLFGKRGVDYQLFFKNDVTRIADDILKSGKCLFDLLYPLGIDRLFKLSVGKLKLVLRL